mmetsp:Transcript_159377/g.487675  ORF Transcript_159377/g.487675 Transcript_159377/m.487675 type:complete len:303 (+) Transcript_159377:369-1277(+)
MVHTSWWWPLSTDCSWRPSGEALSTMPKRWMSNCELSTPPTVPSGFASATARRPGAPGRLVNAVGCRGTTWLLDHSTASAPTQWKLLFVVATMIFVSSTSSQPAPTMHSLTSTGLAASLQDSSETRRTLSSAATTTTSAGPLYPGLCAKTWFTVFPMCMRLSGWPGATMAMEPSLPPRTSTPVFTSHARQERGPCVPSSADASVSSPPAPTSQKRRRPSRQTEMILLAVGQATPTCMSIRAPVPTGASHTWAPASRSQMRSFRSPPAVATLAESGDHAAAQMLPEMPSGLENSLASSPSLPV